MRLFGKVDGAIDRYDRAGWLTLPFDLAFQSTSAVRGPMRIAACEIFTAGAKFTEFYLPGLKVIEPSTPGAAAIEVIPQ